MWVRKEKQLAVLLSAVSLLETVEERVFSSGAKKKIAARTPGDLKSLKLDTFHVLHDTIEASALSPPDFFASWGVFIVAWSENLIFREVEDRDLILRSRRGDVEAFNVLVSRWEKRVYNYLLRQLKGREDALDLTQETFLKA